MSRRRAVVLVLVHVVIFGHLLHWKLAGKTLSPLEPSEAMYTLAEGVMNAGAILLLLSLLATLVVGRFFCGWACHLVALQDLCAWILKKLGIRPRPLRSRLLAFVPLLAGLYMFFWPVIWRWIHGHAGPELRAGFVKEDFWETFPGFWIGALTFLVCGFAMVYLLGAKGFCTYACPYGGLFGVVDRLAPGRIRVTDACKRCGHCTAVCTSNVRVDEEVHRFGMVVDPACMKCQDCVSVCPENALYFGFGRPALGARAKTKRPAAGRRASMPLHEELVLAGGFAFSLLVFQGLPKAIVPWSLSLYGRIPLLLGIGLSVCTALALLLALRLVRERQVTFLGTDLERDGRWTGRGKLAAGLVALALLLVAHSAFVQYHTFQGQRYLGLPGRARAERDALFDAIWSQNRPVLDGLHPDTKASLDRAEAHLQRARRLGLVTDPSVERGLGTLALVRGDPASAARHVERAVRAAPRQHVHHEELGRILAMQGDAIGAARHFEQAAELDPGNPLYRSFVCSTANALVERGHVRKAVDLLARAAARDPDEFEVHRMYAGSLLVAGDVTGAERALRAYLDRHPGHQQAREQLEVLLASRQ